MPDSKEVSTARGLLRSAQSCAIASRRLIESDRTQLAIGILCGHAIEAALKSHLALNGFSDKQLRKIGHDLIAAWEAARTHGMDILPSPPRWLHGLSYYVENSLYRYPPPDSGHWFPEPERLLDTVEELVETMSTVLPEQAFWS